MKNIIIITLSILFFSCNSSNKNVESWTEEEKDILFSECIKYATEIEKMNIEKANDYCYCSLWHLLSLRNLDIYCCPRTCFAFNLDLPAHVCDDCVTDT